MFYLLTACVVAAAVSKLPDIADVSTPDAAPAALDRNELRVVMGMGCSEFDVRRQSV